MLTLCSSSVRRRCLLAGDERRRRHAACLPVMSVAGDMLPGSSQVQGVWAKQLQHVRITGVCVSLRDRHCSLCRHSDGSVALLPAPSSPEPRPAGLGKHRPPPPRKRHQGGRAVGARSSTGRGHGGDATDGNADGARHDDGQKVLQQAARP